ncbi:DEAD/DEAH box helicase [Streptomyces uncialis]|uniref:DEAD/DEAH box helicase n=1 Tax=Streptomyces uncialis TaxID=1048205 RepID=UPI002E2F4C64|nr:DEAD/DEAH box helicase [Streptomyces uncialis]
MAAANGTADADPAADPSATPAPAAAPSALLRFMTWLGRSAELLHGDTKESRRRRIRTDPPDILLTTPESLEAMLIGVKTDHAQLLGGVWAVVVDEVHAFAGDDRGWHLLAVLERLERVTGRPIQRIGLSATVGNPERQMTWLQGAGAGKRPGRAIAPGLAGPGDAGGTAAPPPGKVEPHRRLVPPAHRWTGRRPGSTRNCLLLATTKDTLLQAAALLLRGRGWVEAVTPPPEPRHLVAQQLLAATLQEHRVGDQLWPAQFTVLAGRKEIGQTAPSVLTEERPGPRGLLLGGRSWQVTFVDWGRKRVFVEPADGGGVAKWTSGSVAGLSHTLARAMREVLLGADPPVSLTGWARAGLEQWRDEDAPETVHPGGSLVTRHGTDVRWWTWAGHRANATLAATLPSVSDPVQRPTDCWVRLREDATPELWRAAREGAEGGNALVLPDVDPRAVRGLKFSAALSQRLAVSTLAARLADFEGVRAALAEPVRFESR